MKDINKVLNEVFKGSAGFEVSKTGEILAKKTPQESTTSKETDSPIPDDAIPSFLKRLI